MALAVLLVTGAVPAQASTATITTVDFEVLPDGSEPVDGTPVGDAFGEVLTVPGGEFGVEFDPVSARNTVFVTDDREDGIDPLGIAFETPQAGVTLWVKGSDAATLTATASDADGFEVGVRATYPDRAPGVVYLSDVGERTYTQVTLLPERPISRVNLEGRSIYELCVEGADCTAGPVRLYVDRLSIAVDADPVARVTPGSTSALVGERVVFDASESTGVAGPIERYDWDFDGDGTVDANGAGALYAFDAPGEYDVRLTVFDRGGLAARTTASVVVNAPPVAAIEVVTEDPTAGTAVVFDGSASTDEGSIDGYEWRFSDGATATGRVVAHEFAAAGNYTATLTVTDDRGTAVTATVSVDVVAADSPAAGGEEPAADEAPAGEDGAPGAGPTDDADPAGAGDPTVDGGDSTNGLPVGTTTLGAAALVVALLAVVVALVARRRAA